MGGQCGRDYDNHRATIRDADEVTSEQARIADRLIETVIRVNDGSMIILGGLLQKKELTKEDKVPILGSILLLGRLFSNSHKIDNESELMVVIKPRIIQSAIEEREGRKRNALIAFASLQHLLNLSFIYLDTLDF